MRMRLPVRGILAGLFILALGYYWPLFAADKADPAGELPDVRVERHDGQAVEGRLLTSTFRLKTDFGSQEVEASHIRRIAFRAPDAPPEAEDTIELKDRTLLHGQMLTEEVRVRIDNEERSFKPSDLREVKTLQKKEFNLWVIVLGLVTLTLMEIVLGIDNVIFLAIIAGKLPREQQPKARKVGLAVALGTRLLLLFSLTYLMGLTKPLFTLPDLPFFHQMEAREVSARDLVLLLGGLFLIWKSTTEIHEKLEGEEHPQAAAAAAVSFAKVIFQIGLIDIIFSLDSVITAVGMVEELWVMVVAMVLAMLVMLAFAGLISDFVARHPTLKMLALSFLILIGVMLVAEGLGQHIDKGYIYFAMAFGVGVEVLNLQLRKGPAVTLHERKMPHEGESPLGTAAVPH